MLVYPFYCILMFQHCDIASKYTALPVSVQLNNSVSNLPRKKKLLRWQQPQPRNQPIQELPHALIQSLPTVHNDHRRVPVGGLMLGDGGTKFNQA